MTSCENSATLMVHIPFHGGANRNQTPVVPEMFPKAKRGKPPTVVRQVPFSLPIIAKSDTFRKNFLRCVSLFSRGNTLPRFNGGNSRARLRLTLLFPPFGFPFDKILRRTAHSSLCSSHTLSAKFPCVCQRRRYTPADADGFYDSLLYSTLLRPAGVSCQTAVA